MSCILHHQPFSLTVSLILGLVGSTALGQTDRRFDGSFNARWDISSNWSGNDVPDATDELALFTGDNGSKAYVNLVQDDYTIGQIKVVSPDTAVAIRAFNDHSSSITLDPFAYYGGIGVDMTSATKNFTFSSADKNWSLIVGNSQTWNVDGSGDLTIDSGVGVGLGASHTLTTNVGTGRTISIASVISGTGTSGIIKTGAGTLTLSGANTYSGVTTITNGKLQINGNNSGATGAVTVASGASLVGSGTVGGATVIHGTHNAGDSSMGAGVGSQMFSSTLDYASTSVFDWDLNADLTDSGFDTVSAVGGVDVDDAVFNVIFGSTALAGVTNSMNSFWNTPYGTQTWAMSDIFGANFTGSFASVTTSTDVSDYGSFSINGSSLTWTAVPEPTTALVGLLLGAGLLRRRRA